MTPVLQKARRMTMSRDFLVAVLLCLREKLPLSLLKKMPTLVSTCSYLRRTYSSKTVGAGCCARQHLAQYWVVYGKKLDR